MSYEPEEDHWTDGDAGFVLGVIGYLALSILVGIWLFSGSDVVLRILFGVGFLALVLAVWMGGFVAFVLASLWLIHRMPEVVRQWRGGR